MQTGDNTENEVLKSLPNGVALSWGYVKQQRRGPKGELSVKQIVDAAVAIADKEGLSAVSMGRVAQSFGYSTMSLYRYISSKEDLLILMQDAVCDDIPIPPEEADKDWREGMREYVNATALVFRDHPWFGDIPISSVPITPKNLRIVDWLLRSMRNLPLNDYEKMSMVLLLSGYARSTGLIIRDMDRAIKGGAAPEDFGGLSYSAALKQLIKPDRFPDLHVVVNSGAYTGESDSNNPISNDFDFGLERILDGIDCYIKNK
jgi:AcrR family transcriptional regulator